MTIKSPNMITKKTNKGLHNNQLYEVLSTKGKGGKKYLIGLDKYPVLSEDELNELFKLYYTTGDIEAHDKIILCNLRYLISYCKGFLGGLKSRYNCDRLELKDLIMAGYTGLVKVVESGKFVPGKGNFLSFANYYIRSSLIYYLKRIEFFFGKEIEDRSRSEIVFQGSRIPKGNLKKIDDYIDDFYKNNGRLPRDVEIIEFYMYEEDVGDIYAAKDFLRYYQLLQEGMLSLDEIQDDIDDITMDESENDGTNGKVIIDEYSNADEKLNQESLKTDLFRALSTLTNREQDILKMFFGIGGQESSLGEIGEMFGLSAERTRQIKEKAIRRLKSPNRSKLLIKYLDSI